MRGLLHSLLPRYQHPLPWNLRSVFGDSAVYASGNTICTWGRSVATNLSASVLRCRAYPSSTVYVPCASDNYRTTSEDQLNDDNRGECGILTARPMCTLADPSILSSGSDMMEETRQECEARRAADRGGSAMETQRRMAPGQGTRGTRSPSSLLRTANSTSATALESSKETGERLSHGMRAFRQSY